MLSLARLAGRLRDESGIALILGVGITIVFGLSTVAMIEYTSAGSRTSSISRSSSNAQVLAEAGVNDAQARLNDSANSPLSSTLLTPAAGGVPCPDGVNTCFESAYTGGTTRWFGTYDATAGEWTITSWGLTTNPTDNALTIQRRIRATTAVVPDAMQPNSVPAWSYVLAKGTSDSTTCDVTVNEHAVVDVNFYVQGNLCLNNHGKLLQSDDTNPVEVIVQGKIALWNHGQVGEPASEVSRADVGGGCVSSLSDPGHLCTTADEFFVDDYRQVPTAIVPPAAGYESWYATAKPGPRFPCTTTSGPAPTWDNDTTLNLATAGSAPTFDLTPGSDYTCRYVQNGVTTGELSWVAATRTLTVRGVMYYDGSMTASGAVNVYDGGATIFLTGTLTTSNNTIFCAAKAGSDCDFAGWSPNAEMLVFVVNGGTATNSVALGNGTRFQGGLYAKETIDLGNDVHVEGPMISEDLVLGQHVELEPLPEITAVPVGAPGNPITQATITPPRYS